MADFTITERKEPFTLDEVFSFIDDTNISKMDACELKSRIVDAVQAERNKAIDEFCKKICEKTTESSERCIFPGGIVSDIVTLDYVTDIAFEIAFEMRGAE